MGSRRRRRRRRRRDETLSVVLVELSFRPRSFSALLSLCATNTNFVSYVFSGTALNEYIYDLNMSSAWQMVRTAG